MESASEEAVGLSSSTRKSIPVLSLCDDLLLNIFSNLNANDRFGVAEVCTRWAGIVTRMDWTDILSIDLSSTPAENLGPIIRLCPKLESISAQDCELNVSSITRNLRSELKSLSLYRVSASADHRALRAYSSERLCEDVFGELRSLHHLDELVLHELRIGTVEFDRVLDRKPSFPQIDFQLPGTIKRLMLSTPAVYSQAVSLERAVAPWSTLTCLMLDEIRWSLRGGDYCSPLYELAAPLLRHLRQLRELGFRYSDLSSYCWPTLDVGSNALPLSFLNRLEVLCINANLLDSRHCLHLDSLFSHPTLRILVITGDTDDDRELMPPRRGVRYHSLPRLHVFIGGPIAQKIRFARRSNDAMEIHPITLPMPAFLEQPEVAAIFKGSWIGEMIKRSATTNSPVWNYDESIADSWLEFETSRYYNGAVVGGKGATWSCTVEDLGAGDEIQKKQIQTLPQPRVKPLYD